MPFDFIDLLDLIEAKEDEYREMIHYFLWLDAYEGTDEAKSYIRRIIDYYRAKLVVADDVREAAWEWYLGGPTS